MREIEIQGSMRPHGMMNNDFIDWFRARVRIYEQHLINYYFLHLSMNKSFFCRYVC